MSIPDHYGPDPGHAYQLTRAQAIRRVILFLRLAILYRRRAGGA